MGTYRNECLEGCRNCLTALRLALKGGDNAEIEATRRDYLEALKRMEDLLGRAQLPSSVKSVLVRRYAMGESLTEVARSLHYSRRSVCRQQADGLRRLKKGEGL